MARKDALLVQARDVDRAGPHIPQCRRGRPKHGSVALEECLDVVRLHVRGEPFHRHGCCIVSLLPARRGDGHDPAGRARVRLVGRDAHKGRKVRVAGDDECAVVVVDEVVGEEGDRDGVCQGERRRGGARRAGGGDGVNIHATERGRGDGEVVAGRRERDAVGERDTGDREGVRERNPVRVHIRRMDGDVCDPAQREPRNRLDEREDAPDPPREATRHQMVIAHEKARRARQRERVRGHEIGRTQRADVLRLRRPRRVEHKLLDRRPRARVVDDEQGRRRAGLGRGHVHAERVEVVGGGVAHEGDAVHRVRARDVEEEVAARVGVAERAHDGVPGLPVGVAPEQDVAVCERAVGIAVVPKGDVFAKGDVGGRGVVDAGAVGGPVAADVVGGGEVGVREDVVPGDAATAVGKDGLGV